MRLLLLAALASVLVLGCNPRDAKELGNEAGDVARVAGRAANNAQLAGRVNSVLAQRKGVDMSGLHIEAENGVVTIGGHVRNAEEKRRVQETVEGIRGVDRVVNNLRIQPK